MTLAAVAPLVERHASTQFFTTLYAHQSGVLELRTFPPEGNDKLKHTANLLRDFIMVENGEIDEDRILRFIKGCTKAKLGAFFGVALRSRESLKDHKGDAAHCQTLTTLFVDADYKHLGKD